MNAKELNEIAMLQYQLQRYQAAGNGSMCQHLTAMIRRLSGTPGICPARG